MVAVMRASGEVPCRSGQGRQGRPSRRPAGDYLRVFVAFLLMTGGRNWKREGDVDGKHERARKRWHELRNALKKRHAVVERDGFVWLP